jgi:hypothetical protein
MSVGRSVARCVAQFTACLSHPHDHAVLVGRLSQPGSPRLTPGRAGERLEIAHERVGDGPPLAFLHDAATDGRVWRPQLLSTPKRDG